MTPGPSPGKLQDSNGSRRRVKPLPFDQAVRSNQLSCPSDTSRKSDLPSGISAELIWEAANGWDRWMGCPRTWSDGSGRGMHSFCNLFADAYPSLIAVRIGHAGQGRPRIQNGLVILECGLFVSARAYRHPQNLKSALLRLFEHGTKFVFMDEVGGQEEIGAHQQNGGLALSCQSESPQRRCAGLPGSRERRWARGKGALIGSNREIFGRAAVGPAGTGALSRYARSARRERNMVPRLPGPTAALRGPRF